MSQSNEVQPICPLIPFTGSLMMNSFEHLAPDPNSQWLNVNETCPKLCSWSLLNFHKSHLAASGTGHCSLTLGEDPAWQAVHLQPARGKGGDTVREHHVVSLFLNLSKLTGVESKLLAHIQPWTILYRDVMVCWREHRSWNPKDQSKMLAPTTDHTLGNSRNFSGPPNSPRL